MKYILSFRLANSKGRIYPKIYYLGGMNDDGTIWWDVRKEKAWVMDLESAEDWRMRLLSRASVLNCVIEPVKD